MTFNHIYLCFVVKHSFPEICRIETKYIILVPPSALGTDGEYGRIFPMFLPIDLNIDVSANTSQDLRLYYIDSIHGGSAKVGRKT